MSEKSYLVIEDVIVDAGTDTDLVNHANALGLEGGEYEITEEVDFQKQGVLIDPENGSIFNPDEEDFERLRRIFGSE